MDNVTNSYTPKDMTQMLHINSETLRKYSLALEGASHVFMRTKGGHREYYQKDVMTLNHFIALLPTNGMTLEMAAQIVVAKQNQPSKSVTVSENPSESTQIKRSDERYIDLMGKIELLDHVPMLIKKLQEAEQRDQEKTKKLEELQAMVRQQGEQLQRIESSVSSFGVADLAKELHKMRKAETAAAEERQPVKKKKRFGFF